MHLVGFIIRKFVTMHGHMNVTFLFFSSAGEVSGILFFPSINVPIL